MYFKPLVLWRPFKVLYEFGLNLFTSGGCRNVDVGMCVNHSGTGRLNYFRTRRKSAVQELVTEPDLLAIGKSFNPFVVIFQATLFCFFLGLGTAFVGRLRLRNSKARRKTSSNSRFLGEVVREGVFGERAMFSASSRSHESVNVPRSCLSLYPLYKPVNA